MARAHLFIKGRVQGVFYRAFARDVAYSLGLTGWVMNLHDGRVEAVFEGEREIVEQAVKKCNTGPPGAYVSDIDVSWGPYSEGYKGFTIKYY